MSWPTSIDRDALSPAFVQYLQQDALVPQPVKDLLNNRVIFDTDYTKKPIPTFTGQWKDRPTGKGLHRKETQVPANDYFDVSVTNPMQSLRVPVGVEMPAEWDPLKLEECSTFEIAATVIAAQNKTWPTVEQMDKNDPRGLAVSRQRNSTLR